MSETPITQEWIREYDYYDRGTLLFLERLRGAGFNDREIESILGILDGICHDCWNDDDGCRCWDES